MERFSFYFEVDQLYRCYRSSTNREKVQWKDPNIEIIIILLLVGFICTAFVLIVLGVFLVIPLYSRDNKHKNERISRDYMARSQTVPFQEEEEDVILLPSSNLDVKDENITSKWPHSYEPSNSTT